MGKLKNFKTRIDGNSIILICVVKDEYLLLEYFIDYYKSIGVSHFIFINNGSTDETLEYLLNHPENILLFDTKSSYKDNNFGVSWVTKILNKYCINKWCLVIDADELLYIDNLKVLKLLMKSSGSNVCKFYLLDMYPKNFGEIYERGKNFLTHSEYYDKESEINNSLSNSLMGGIRKRVFNLNPCLKKKSFFLYNFSCCNKLQAGYHWLENFGNHTCVNYYEKYKIILHFKFIKPDLKKFYTDRVKMNQDWNESSEYKTYLEQEEVSFYDDRYSLSFFDVPPELTFLEDISSDI